MWVARPDRLTALLATVVAIVVALAAATSAAAATTRPAIVAPSPGISVQGNRLYANGTPFVARGVQVVGLVAPPAYLWGKYIAAGQHFGLAELEQAAADHANLVRFQVSEYGLDPANAEYSPAYVAEVRSGIELARSLGLYVLVSLQSEAAAGRDASAHRCPLPDAGALTAWNELASMFAADRGVMFELYNEPSPAATASGWSEWLNGGTITYGRQFGQSCTAIGMQQLVDQIRADGADNVIVLPALGGETNLSRVPTVSDPADPSDPQLAYGIHYPNLPLGIPSWNKAFGNFAARAPVLVTEWVAAGISAGCTPGTPQQSVELLDYLASKRIGVVGFAFDLPGTIVTDYSYTPTAYANPFQCTAAGGGPGQILFDDYAAEAQGETLAQSSGLDGPAAWQVSRGAASRLLAASPTAAQLLFNTPYTYVAGAGVTQTVAAGLPNAVPTATFKSAARLVTQVSAGALRPGTVAVEYAPTLHGTPRQELVDPASAFQQAALIAHQHGLLFIAAPALQIVKATAPHLKTAKLTNKFLKRRIAAIAARDADVYVIQAQSLERAPQRFSAFVRQAAAQAVNAHGSIELLTEVRSGAGERAPTAPMLESDLFSAGPSVSGYDLYDPGSADLATLPAIDLINAFAGDGGLTPANR